MPASVIEQILARAAAALTGVTLAGTRVYRGREDAFADDEVPALNIRRDNSDETPFGGNGSNIRAVFNVDHHVDGSTDWETTADALHMQVHAVIAADAALALLGRGLRCTGTDAQGDRADRVVGKLTARYEMQVFVRPGDLTRAIT